MHALPGKITYKIKPYGSGSPAAKASYHSGAKKGAKKGKKAKKKDALFIGDGGLDSLSKAGQAPAAEFEPSVAAEIRQAAMKAMEREVVKKAVRTAITQSAHHPAIELELTEALQTVGAGVTFTENFAAGLKARRVSPPAVATTIAITDAVEASKKANAASLGKQAPPPPPKAPKEPPPNWFPWVLLAILLLACCCCFIFLCCQQTERSYNPFKAHPPEETWQDTASAPLYAQPNSLVRPNIGGGNSSGVPIQAGSNAPIGAAPPGSTPESSTAPGGVYGGRPTPRSTAPPSAQDPRRADQIVNVCRELENAQQELASTPWYKRQQVQSRINELEKWKAKLEDETRPLYASAYDPSAGAPVDPGQQRSRQAAAAGYNQRRSVGGVQNPEWQA